MGKNQNSGQKKSSMLLVLLLSIGGTIAVLNTIQNVLVARITRSEIVEDDSAMYDNLTEVMTYSISNMLSGYQKELNTYVDADVMRTGTFDEMADWLVAHESLRGSDFDYIMLAGPDGIAHTDIGTTSDISSRHYFSAIMREGKTDFIGNPLLSKTTGQTVVHVSRAVQRDGRTIAMIAGVVNINTVTKSLANIKIGKTGYPWILADDGMVIYHPVSEYIMNKNFITGLSAGHEDMAAVATQIASGATGSAWIKGLNGGKDYITYKNIPGSTWNLAVTVPQGEFYDLVDLIRNTLIGFAVVVVVITIVVGGLLLYANIKPLQTVQKTIAGIASGNADLTQRIELKSNNEIGMVVQGFNKFTEKLQTIIGSVKDSKDELGTAGADMQSTAQDTASAITEIIANIDSFHNQIQTQKKSVDQTAGAVDEISSNIESLNHMIENQASGVAEASSAVEEMIGNINSVNRSMEKMSEKFTALKDRSQLGFEKLEAVNTRVQKIETQSATLQDANVAIASIASQTNLLAMNAAIEAAHAGEAGKGFAVVADEIRKLSETSSLQSKQISTQLSEIKESILEVVTASTESSQTFSQVSDELSETSNLVTQIQTAMEEQNEGSRQIAEALKIMNDSTTEVRNASSEMREGNKLILDEVHQLQDVTVAMKQSMDEMFIGAQKINETGAVLTEVSGKVQNSIQKIGQQIDEFKV